MTPFQREQLDVIRRLAERGRSMSEIVGYDAGHHRTLDVFQGILDELDRTVDRCSRCAGRRGGVPGNENVVDGQLLCDHCHADDLAAIDRSLSSTETQVLLGAEPPVPIDRAAVLAAIQAANAATIQHIYDFLRRGGYHV